MDELREALNFAVDKEREAEAFYRSWEGRAKDPAVRSLFSQLASWEQGHLERLLEVDPAEFSPTGKASTDMKLSDLLVDVKASPEMSLQEAFVVAMKREEASAALYRGLASSVEGSAGELLANLREEEERHKQLLQREYDQLFLAEN